MEDLGHSSDDDPAFNAPIQGIMSKKASVEAGAAADGNGGFDCRKDIDGGVASKTFEAAKRVVASRQLIQQTMLNIDVNATVHSLRQRALATQLKADTGGVDNDIDDPGITTNDKGSSLL